MRKALRILAITGPALICIMLMAACHSVERKENKMAVEGINSMKELTDRNAHVDKVIFVEEDPLPDERPNRRGGRRGGPGGRPGGPGGPDGPPPGPPPGGDAQGPPPPPGEEPGGDEPEDKPRGVRHFYGDVLDAQNQVIGTIYGVRVETFGTRIRRIQWKDGTVTDNEGAARRQGMEFFRRMRNQSGGGGNEAPQDGFGDDK